MKLNRLSLLILAAAPCFASNIYQVTVNASSLPANTSGFIDFGFNGGLSATAVISNFSAPGTALNAGSISTFGTVAGSLPGTVTMGDDNADYDEGLTFGSTISFQLAFSGTAGGTVGDLFTLTFINSTFDGFLLTGNLGDGWIAQFQLDTLGNVTPTTFTNPSGGPTFATITSVVPEPAPAGMAIAGLLAAVAFVRLRNRAEA